MLHSSANEFRATPAEYSTVCKTLRSSLCRMVSLSQENWDSMECWKPFLWLDVFRVGRTSSSIIIRFCALDLVSPARPSSTTWSSGSLTQRLQLICFSCMHTCFTWIWQDSPRLQANNLQAFADFNFLFWFWFFSDVTNRHSHNLKTK